MDLSEEQEQIALVQYCELKGYKFTAIPNSTFTRSWSVKNRNTRMGVRAGFPDMVVIAGDKFMAIELKRVKNSTTSKTQKEWIEALNEAGIPARVCKGHTEAISFIQEVIGEKQENL